MTHLKFSRRITRQAHDSTVDTAELEDEDATQTHNSYLGRSKHPGHVSLFHKNTISFAPNAEALPSHIDAIANLPSPYLIRRASHERILDFPFLHSDHDPGQSSTTSYSDDDGFNYVKHTPSPPKLSKVPLPPPYKKHWTEIDRRRAKRDFIYGRDEEYEFSERDNRVKSSCCGILYFHTIELLDLVVNTQSFVDNIPVSFYCNLSIGAIKRTTKIVHSTNPSQVKIDSGVHLAIEISEWRDASSNKLRLELWSFQDPEAHFIVGTVEMHIYNFIRLQYLIETAHLWSDGIKVGKLAFEAAFSYGALGFGHSNQLMNFAQPLMETISHSMFPRIKLDETADICDLTFQSRKPDNLKMFSYHSFILEMDAKNPYASAFYSKGRREPHIKLEPMPMTINQVDFKDGFPLHAKLHMNIWQKKLQADFNDMYGEFVCLGHKRERLEYLTNMVQGRMRDMHETDTGILFNQLNSKDTEKIHRTEMVPGEIIFPKRVPCASSEPFKLDPEDQTFQDQMFPQVRREQGYLATLFGYKKKDAANKFLNDMDYPVYKAAKLPEIKNVTVMNCSSLLINWIKWSFIRLKAFTLKYWSFIFPELTHNLEIPGISLTVATPEGSTTKIHAYFAREGKDISSSKKVEKLVQQTSVLIGMTKKPKNRKKQQVHTHNGEDESSSSDYGDEEKLKHDLES